MENSGINEISPNNSLYYLGLVLGLIVLLLTETFLKVPDVLLGGVELISVTALSLHFLSRIGELSPWSMILSLILFVLALLIGYNTDSLFLMFFLFASVYGARGLLYSDILKVYFRTSAIFCLSILLLCYLGYVKNKIDYAFGREMLAESAERNSFGYVWPTDLASHIFFILLAFWLLKKGRLSIMSLIFYLLVTYWLLVYTDARLGCGCILLIILFSIYLRFQSTFPSLLNALFGRITIVWIPILFLGSILITINYDSSDLVWVGLNVILSGRLRIGQEMFDYAGVTLLGQVVEMNGGDVMGGEYSYIDSSFLQSIIIYGVIFSVILLVAYVCVSYKAFKRNDFVFLCAVFISGLSGFIAQHFLQIFMNPLLIALFAGHVTQDDSEILEDEDCELPIYCEKTMETDNPMETQ